MKYDINKYLTPYKLGKPVLTGTGKAGAFDSMAVDCPFVFFHQNKFHMMYVGFDGTGYQTGLAVSDDLLHWEPKGVILKREENASWDSIGAAGTWIVKSSNNLYDIPTLKKVNGKYWMVYHSYPGEGYETGAAQIGLAWTEDENLMKWNRLKEPVFSWKNGDDWDKGGLYKACIIEHENLYYLFYNAKNITYGDWIEQTGVAISEDMIHWKRYKDNPVLEVKEDSWDSKFCSDPCVLWDGDRWVMFYFGLDGKHAQDGIAFSNDLLHWERHPQPILRYGKPDELDENHAHKPAIIYYNGVLYHFYCGTRKYRDGDITKNFHDEFRCITVATSEHV